MPVTAQDVEKVLSRPTKASLVQEFRSWYRNDVTYMAFDCGANPYLVNMLAAYVRKHARNMSEIHMSMYIGNSPVMLDALAYASDSKVKVTLVTIPFSGYENYVVRLHKAVYSDDGNPFSSVPLPLTASKLGKAMEGYEKYGQSIRMLACPAVSMFNYCKAMNATRGQDVKALERLSRKEMLSKDLKTILHPPFSNHTKMAVFRFKDGHGTGLITSSNMCVGDQAQTNLMVKVSLSPEETETSCRSMEMLEKISFPYEAITPDMYWDNPEVSVCRMPELSNFNVLGPFYDQSNRIAEDVISTMIGSAHVSVHVCAEHVAPNGKILDSLVAAANRGVMVFVVSMTGKNREVNNKELFEAFRKKMKSTANVVVLCDDHEHRKFLVVDGRDVAIFTMNLTMTTLAYRNHNVVPADLNLLDSCRAKMEEDLSVVMPSYVHRGICSEIGSMAILRDRMIAGELVRGLTGIPGNVPVERPRVVPVHQPKPPSS